VNKIVMVVGIPLVLAACGKPVDVAPADSAPLVQQQAEPETASPHPVATAVGDAGMDMLASRGLEVPFPYAVNYDIKDVSKNGTPRRRVLLEILDGPFEDSAAAFEAILTGNGYSLADAASTPGKLQRTYVKEGDPTYYLLMHSRESGPSLSNPAAVGSVHVMWNDR
jgi:hypothetical protein